MLHERALPVYQVAPQSFSFQKGQKITYEGEEGEIVSVDPFFVIKTRTRVVCGNVRGVRPNSFAAPHSRGV